MSCNFPPVCFLTKPCQALRAFLLFATLAICLALSEANAQPADISAGETSLQASPADGKLAITLAGTARKITSEGELWYFRVYDADTAQRNTNPLHGRESVYWGDTWKPSHAKVSSRQAQLTEQRQENGRLTLRYRHPLAEVEVTYTITPESVTFAGQIHNLGTDPICDFCIVPGLQFQLAQGETIIAPDQTWQGVEYTQVFSFSWGITSAWNGFLIRETDGRGFTAFDSAQDIDREYLPNSCDLQGDGSNLRFSTAMRFFARPGETRSSARLVMRHFPDLRTWADTYIRLNFPTGLRTLREKLTPELFDKFSRAYLAPTYGTIKEAAAFLPNVPGTYIVHPPAWMHPTAHSSNNWDVFPNYFPPSPAKGTQQEYDALVKSIRESGQFFMPRNSFFYWGEGTDFALTHDLADNAIVREDGKPRTAKWAHPGYLVSPSAKPVLAELDRILATWQTMGANLYFTNVIGAFDPYNNRYDFHRDSPAPDQLYSSLYRLLRRHGEKLPLLTEGGGFWQLPYQVGFCNHPGWSRLHPVDGPRSNPKRATLLRAAPEVPLYLDHEYVIFLPGNTSFDDGPYSIHRISYSLAHGIGMKCGFNAHEPPEERNRLLMRTIALLADKVQSRLHGARLLDYRHSQNGTVTANYGGSSILYNPSPSPVPFATPLLQGEIATDGFGFLSADKQVTAGYFSSLDGKNLSKPILLVAELLPANSGIKLYAPWENQPVDVFLQGRKVSIPAYPAVMARTVPGVTLQADGAVLAERPAVVPPNQHTRRTGLEKPPVIPPYDGPMPLRLEWRHGQELPPPLRGLQPLLTSKGLSLRPAKQPHIFESPELAFRRRFRLEILFRVDVEPDEPVRFGEVNLLRAEASDGSVFKRTLEMRYHLYRDSLRFLMASKDYRYLDYSDRTFTLQANRFYHLVFEGSGQNRQITINGQAVLNQTLDKLELEPSFTKWRIGDTTTSLTFLLLRIAGD